MRGVLAMALLASAGCAFAQAGETMYVGDQFEIGVHESKSLASTITELLPSGTALEVLERDGAMVQVRTPGGESGWVDGRFLSETEPGRARVQAMEAELAGAQAALADLQAKLAALENQSPAAPESGDEAPTPISSDALREMQLLAQENQRLKQQVAELEAVQRMAVERGAAPVAEAAAAPAAAAAAPDPAAAAPESLAATLAHPARWETWQVLLFASVLLLAFAAGGWMVDWGIRRRHGGFRV
jgi:SH3 domain protein